MKPVPRALRPALAKQIRLLTSDADGEVLATARAIGRTLKAGSCDIHDLAGLVEAPSTTPEASFHDHFDDSRAPPAPKIGRKITPHPIAERRRFPDIENLFAFLKKIDSRFIRYLVSLKFFTRHKSILPRRVRRGKDV